MKTLSEKDGLDAIRDHAAERGMLIRTRYGPQYSENTLHTLLQDRQIVRYPTRILFDERMLLDGEPACAVEVDDSEDRHFIMAVHPMLRSDAQSLAAAVLYQLVRINYGEHATHEHAETLGATAMGLSADEYYSQMCSISDSLTPV